MCSNISTRLLRGVNPTRLESATNNVSPAKAKPAAPPSRVSEAPKTWDVKEVCPITRRAACPVTNGWAKAAPAHSEKKAQYLSIDGSERGSYQYNNLLTFYYPCTLPSTLATARMPLFRDAWPWTFGGFAPTRLCYFPSKLMLVAASNFR